MKLTVTFVPGLEVMVIVAAAVFNTEQASSRQDKRLVSFIPNLLSKPGEGCKVPLTAALPSFLSHGFTALSSGACRSRSSSSPARKIEETSYAFLMPRQLRLEYEGAVYHVMARGDRREPIYQEEGIG